MWIPTFIRLSLFFLFVFAFACGEATTNGFYDSPPPFEKIYVNPGQILCTPAGIFLKCCDGTKQRVRTVLHDSCGMYVLCIQMQCPQCGRCYDGKTPHEGFCCPLYEKEFFPGFWALP